MSAFLATACSSFGAHDDSLYEDESSYEDAFTSLDEPEMHTGMGDEMGDVMGETDMEQDSAYLDGPARGTAEDFALSAGERVYFDLDSHQLDDEDRAVLQRQAQWLLAYPSIQVLLGGHCDERGTRDYNLALGARRANAVREYLESLGVDGERISTISYGKERPLDEGHNEVAWSLNRHVHTQVTGEPDGI